MENIFRLVFILCLFSFKNIPNKVIKPQKQLLEPSFLDNRKTVDSLKKIYGSETITFDKWDKEATDSCLFVCLINSTIIPKGFENTYQFKNIASAIKKVLVYPKNYKSIYVIFVTKLILNGKEAKMHTAGMEVFSSEI
ncbi:MAG: hypothetical protein Q8K92_23530 [Leadbetterella sp.]|nr:hypothetical protein [Leadbetterella sp.]